MMRALKVHLETSSGVNSNGEKWQSSRCGTAFRYHWHDNVKHCTEPLIVKPATWPWLPRRAMCGSCLNLAAPHSGFSRVTHEIELAIEAALVGIARSTSRWPDAWQVDPHGGNGNPHVWFPRPDEGPTAKRCPCGRVTGWFARPDEPLPAHLATHFDGTEDDADTRELARGEEELGQSPTSVSLQIKMDCQRDRCQHDSCQQVLDAFLT